MIIRNVGEALIFTACVFYSMFKSNNKVCIHMTSKTKTEEAL